MSQVLSQFARAAIALGVMLVAYQIYAFTIDPLVDPPLTRKPSSVDPDDLAAGQAGLSRYQRVLASYFPANHWSLDKPPIVIESGQLMLVVSRYTRNDNGSIDIDNCAVLFFPTPRKVGETPPSDAVVLEAPGGAHLQFDEDFDPVRGRMGRIVHGDFPGAITIRSEMRDPGTDDDLWIETRDLTMNEAVIKTLAEVKLRYGRSVGSGRHLEIGLARDNYVRQGMNLVGIRSLEIREDVSLRLQLEGLSVTGNTDRVVSRQPLPVRLVSTNPSTAGYEPPVTITCDRSFFFDFINYKAIFDRNVKVRQERLEGPFDSLDCNVLSLLLAREDATSGNIKSASGRGGATRMTGLRPQLLAAEGSVRLEAPSQQISARADRLQVNIPLREMTIDSGPEISLRHGKHTLRVASYGQNRKTPPVIVYRHPEKESPHALGDLTVTGPGRLQLHNVSRGQPRPIELSWNQVDGGESAVVLRRLDGQPVLTIAGAPQVSAASLGTLVADRMQLYLREVEPDGDDGPAIEIDSNAKKRALLIDRMAATGKVEVNTPQLTGTTRQLQVWFRQQAMVPSEVPGVSTVSQSNGGDGGSTQKNVKHRYDFESEQVSIDVAMSGRKVEPLNVTCQGGVVLRETAGMAAGEEPLRLVGQALRIESLSTKPLIDVRGTPVPGDANQAGLASITARGLTLYAKQVNADAENSRFWVEGPGKAQVMVDGQILGEQAGTKVPVHLTWRGGLSVDGSKIVCSGDLFAESEHSWMQCDRVVAKLSRPIYPNNERNRRLEIVEVSLLGNIVADHRVVDERGQRSHNRAQLRSLNYNHQTGDYRGEGPGKVRSAHLSNSKPKLGGNADEPAGSPARLRYARIDFDQGISGNATQRVLRFHRRVRGIYGPIDGWQQELFENDPNGLPPETIKLRCDQLQVNEDPASRQAPSVANSSSGFGMLEALAKGNVVIDGTNEKQERFVGTGSTASYNQRKEIFVLRGVKPTYAELNYFDPESGRQSNPKAEEFIYYVSPPRIKINGLPQATFNPGTSNRSSGGTRPGGGPIAVPPRPGR